MGRYGVYWSCVGRWIFVYFMCFDFDIFVRKYYFWMFICGINLVEISVWCIVLLC